MPYATGISEAELIRKCKKGDLRYQEKLYKCFFSYAMGVGLRYLSNRDDALEAVNDAFIKAFGAMHHFNEDLPFKPWLSRIVVNTAIDRRRKDLKYMEEVDLDGADCIMIPSHAVEKLNAQHILKLLNELPNLQRTVFNLYEIDGYSHDEIGGMLNIAASSSRVYLSRAKEKLKQAWTKEQEYYGRTI